MEIITKYKAEDGSVFNSEYDCMQYERLCLMVNEFMQELNPLPKENGCNFANGGGYIQQKKRPVERAKKEIVDLGKRWLASKHNWSFNSIGRLFDDSGVKCLYHAWGRLSNIDTQYREWGQGYYAINPHKGVQKPYTVTP